MHGPAVATPVESPRAGKIEEGAEDSEERPQQVEIPLRRESPRLERRRQGRAREQLGGRRVGEFLGGYLLDGRRGARERRGDAGGRAHDDELGDDDRPQGCSGPDRALHASDEHAAVGGAERPERDERDDLGDEERAVRRCETLERADADLRAHEPGDRDDDEGNEGEGRVAREHSAESIAESAAREHESEQAPHPDGREDAVQVHGRDRRVVVGRAARVPRLRDRPHGGDGEHEHTGQERGRAHGEAEHGDDSRDECRREPRLPELALGEERGEQLAEAVVERDRLEEDAEEDEEPRGDGPECPQGRARSRHVECAIVGGRVAREREE